MKKVVLAVISDLVSDQRVDKVATFLHEKGCEVLLIGRKFEHSPTVDARSYLTTRIRCRYKNGPLQYIEFNIRLFLRLLRTDAHIYVSNDLDTLLPVYAVAVLKNKPIVYDAHEYFTGVPELMEKKVRRRIWKMLERLLLPRLKHAYTVNESIANLYRNEYGIDMRIVRNLPRTVSSNSIIPDTNHFEETKILIMQGAGINRDRGFEEAIQAMRYLDRSFLLWIVGSGTIIHELRSLVQELALQNNVTFIDRVPYLELMKYTRQAFLGLSLDKPVSLNNELSLPNKLFDYLNAGVPVLATALPEVKKIIDHYDVGKCISAADPILISDAIKSIAQNGPVYSQWKLNTSIAMKELNWANETKVLDEVYAPLLLN